MSGSLAPGRSAATWMSLSVGIAACISSQTTAGGSPSGTADAGGVVDVADGGGSDAASTADALADACKGSDSDPRNCGICAHDCGAAPCNHGACGTPPVVVTNVDTPTFVTVNDPGLFWVSTHPAPPGSSGDSSVMTCPVTGCAGAASTLWSGLYGLGGLAALDAALFWPVGPGPGGEGGAGEPAIMRCSTAGCAMPQTIAEVNANVTGFTAGSAGVFWTSKDGAVSTCAVAGCSSPSVIASQQNEPAGIAVDVSGVYWANSDEGTVLTCPLSGCSGQPTVLATGQARPTAIAVAGGIVYWMNLGVPMGGGNLPVTGYSGGAVMKCAATGCSGQPDALASYPLWLGGAALVADSQGVYWSSEDVSGHYGSIETCAASGCAGMPTAVATTSDRDPTVGLALDSAHVFWSDRAAGEILMTSR